MCVQATICARLGLKCIIYMGAKVSADQTSGVMMMTCGARASIDACMHALPLPCEPQWLHNRASAVSRCLWSGDAAVWLRSC